MSEPGKRSWLDIFSDRDEKGKTGLGHDNQGHAGKHSHDKRKQTADDTMQDLEQDSGDDDNENE